MKAHKLDKQAETRKVDTLKGIALMIARKHIELTGTPYRAMVDGKPVIFVK